MNLTEFLLARIADDELTARQASGDRLLRMSQADETIIADAGFMQTFTTARVLAECDAKRRIVEWYSGSDPDDQPVMRLLALPYADHPDYDPAWRS